MNTFLIVLPLVFLAGFIDAIAGGGGLIALPAYLFAGIPIHIAMGTNKLSSSLGTLSASLTFFFHRKLWLKLAFFASFFSLIGSFFGAQMALLVSPILLKYLLVLVLPLMANFVLRKKKVIEYTESISVPWILIASISFFVGMYDGFLGPGTGSILIFAFVTFVRMDYTQASANAKIVNLASGAAAFTAFAMSGQVDFKLGLWAALFSILGNYSGSLLAIRFGKKIIQPLLIIVFGLLMLKLIYDLVV